jgi:putative ABC transport system substrate-binding protein
MKRRQFITLLGGAAASVPLSARAQQPAMPVRRVAVLIATKEGDPEGMARLAAFTQGLAGAGWTNGRNLRIDVGWLTGDADLIRAATAEMVGLKPDVICAATTPVVAALQRIAGTIPIVFVQVSDPIGSGFVQSLARPGGTITGFLNFEASLVGKWLELLATLGVRRAAALFNPQTSNGKYYLDALNTAAAAVGVPAAVAEVGSDDGIDAAIGKLEGDGGLIVMPDGFTSTHRRVIIAKAAQYRVPAIYPYRYMATDGGLIAYGVDAIDFYRRAPAYVDRILKGEKAADLPTEQPTKFQLIINLKTAKALGIEIPPTLLATADGVIE